MGENKWYTVERRYQDRETVVNGRMQPADMDLGTFTTLQDAVDYRNSMSDMQTRLIQLGVRFSAGYRFSVRVNSIGSDGGMRTKPVVLRSDDDSIDVEFEDDDLRKELTVGTE